MNLDVNAVTTVGPVVSIDRLIQISNVLGNTEGKGEIGKQVAYLSTAVGDMCASLVGTNGEEDLHDEIAGVILRVVQIGVARGLSSAKLKNALGREAEFLIQKGVEARIDNALKGAGFSKGHDGESIMSQLFDGATSRSGKTSG